MTLSNMTLVKLGAIGGIATISMAMLYRNQLNYNIRQTAYYKEALKTLREHKGAVYLLGEPIKDRRIDVSDTKINFSKENLAQYKVPLKGSKQKGTLYFWAEKSSEIDAWSVTRMELELDSDVNRRLLVKPTSENKL